MNATVQAPRPTLTYCDRCGYSDGRGVTRATTQVVLASGFTLDFCTHHFLKYEGRLRSLAIDIITERPE